MSSTEVLSKSPEEKKKSIKKMKSFENGPSNKKDKDKKIVN